jgi:hypothetical protein
MNKREIGKLCNMADKADPVAYAKLCERDIDDDEFVAELRKIITSKRQNQ